jgi:hypothetical protein
MRGKNQVDWQSPEYQGFCPTALNWAQMAAYIDGEGSILINTQRPKKVSTGFYLRVTVANTDVRLMVWLKDIFGGTFKDANTDRYYVGKNWKRAYHWGTSSTRAAWILHNCLPYFVLKVEQAQIGLSLQESLSGHNFRGANSVTPEVREERQQLKQRLLVLKAKGINGVPVPSGPVAKTA